MGLYSIRIRRNRIDPAYVATLLTGIQIVDIQKAIDPHAVGANILAGSIDTRAQMGAPLPFDVKAIDVKTADERGEI